MKFFGLALLVLVGSAGTARAFPVARLRGTRPRIEVKHGGANWVPARERGGLVFGDILRTDARGGAELLFNNGTRVTLRARSQMQILAPDSAGKPLILRVFGAFSEVFVRAKGPTEIRTTAATAAVRGTEYGVKIGAENQTILTVQGGRVAFFNPQGEVVVGADQQSVAVLGSAPTPPVAVDASGLLSWTLESAGLPLELDNFFAPPQNEGQRLFNAGRATEAARFFAAQVQTAPDATNLLNLGRASLSAGDLPAAQSAFERVLALGGATNGAQSEAKIGLAQIALGRGDLAGARALLIGTENSPRGALVAGLVALRAGEIGEAQVQLRAAVAQNGASYEAQSLLAIALLQSGDSKNALQNAQNAVKIAPDAALPRAALSLALFFGGDLAAARPAARRALQLDPFSPLALIAYARGEAAAGDLDEARQATEQAAALAPDFPLVGRDLGAIYTQLKLFPKAEVAFRAVLLRVPNDGAALAGLGTVLSQTGRSAEAGAAFDAAIANAPRDASVRAQFAGFLIEQGQLERARTEAETFLRVNLQNGGANTGGGPEFGALFIRLSEEALYRQNLREAFDYGRRAVAALPQSAPAHYQLGRVFLEQERNAQAQNQFRLAAALDPNLARARYAVGLTQELLASGRDISRPLGQIAAASESGPGQALSVQNLATPGANQRLQAAIQDPTVIRTATRSYGDTQLDGALGEDGIRFGSLSTLKESKDRRGLLGVSASRDQNDGVRENAGFETSRVGLVIGQKRRDSESGFFGLAQTESSDIGTNDGLVSNPNDLNIVRKNRKPLVVAGYNQQWSQKVRTRFLLQGDRAHGTIEGGARGYTSDADYRGFHGEVRHDARLGDAHLLSAGASLGRRTFAQNNFLPAPLESGFPDLTSIGKRSVGQLTLYLRDEWLATPKLRVTAELKGQRLRDQLDVLATFNPVPAPPAPDRFITNTRDRSFVGLPTLLLSYQASPRTNIRARARQIYGSIIDFESLSPSDIFLFDSSEAPIPNFRGRGRAYEAELSHTFANASLFRIGLFQQSSSETSNQISNDGESLFNAHFRGIRAGYEGIVSPQLTYFLNLNYNAARGAVDFGDGVVNPQALLSSVPRVQSEVGFQYLSDQGFFVQPTLAYIGSRLEPDEDLDLATPRARRGGFGLFNARIGKRAGLRSVVFLEALNLLDKTYATGGGIASLLQPGRQFRVGASLRF